MIHKKKIKLPRLIGHRGVKNLCPENTLNSINKAFDLGLNFVEVDVKISKDKIPILLHDDTLNRTTNGNGYVIDYEYNHIKKLDAGEHFYNKKTKIFVPKLIDVLKLCKKRKSNLNIELKPNIGCEKINASSKPIEITIMNKAITYLGALDVIEKILLGSRNLTLDIISFNARPKLIKLYSLTHFKKSIFFLSR